MNQDVMFSAEKADWQTPDAVFKQLDQEFAFSFDADNERDRARCRLCFSPDMDATKTNWPADVSIWCNPPYGRDTGAWLEQGYVASLSGSTVVFLLPARTDTRWFHKYAPLAEIRFIKGRLRFKGANASAPFPSMLVIFRPNKAIAINAATVVV
jgi:phage N-6-adenine-methyltransferase